tara:strand:+ start:359 stop:1261 length:903 start_codon:yes stop_codon:yes gene_type:complete
MNNLQGWINIYKPQNISSGKVINLIKKKFQIKKLGHVGTLDPLAEGVLPIAIGKTTKLIPFVNTLNKEYEFDIKWGEQTSTDDREGTIIARSNNIPNNQTIKKRAEEFLGWNLQKPPKASAVKINGIRAYKLFRANIDFEIKNKKVFLSECKILESNNDITKFYIICSKGFYIRSFARDLAEKLDTTGHIFSLKRTKVGKFSINNAILLDDLLKIRQTHSEFKDIHPSISMLDDILAYEIDDEELIKEISQGKSVKIDKNFITDQSLSYKEKTLFITYNNLVLSFGNFDGCFFKPKKVLI